MESRSNRKAEEDFNYYFKNTNTARSYDLFRLFAGTRKRLDGTPIPRDFNLTELWNEVDKQLRKEGLRLSPAIRDLSKIKFDENGYMVSRHHK